MPRFVRPVCQVSTIMYHVSSLQMYLPNERNAISWRGVLNVGNLVVHLWCMHAYSGFVYLREIAALKYVDRPGKVKVSVRFSPTE